MNYRTMERIGRTLKSIHVDDIHRAFSAKDYVRISFTHHVKKEDEANFELIVRYFKENYRVLKPQEFLDSLESAKPFKGKNILLTFDDGLKSSYKAAQKILSKYGVKAIFFIPTQILELSTGPQMKAFVEKHVYYGELPANGLSVEEYETMSAADILELVKDGHSIFPHTHSHLKLKDISDPVTVQKEIAEPKKILENLVKMKMNAFAFPIGTERVVSSYAFSAIKKEYRFCFTGLAGKNTHQIDPYFIHRDCVHAHYSLTHIKNLMDGVFDPYYFVKMSLLKKIMNPRITRTQLGSAHETVKT